MSDLRFCYNCNKEVEFSNVIETKKYKYRGIEFDIESKIKVCKLCNEQLPINIDDIENEEKDFFNNVYEKYLNRKGLNLKSFKEIRKKTNLNQELFSKVTNISKRNIIRYEKNQSIPEGVYLTIYERLNNDSGEIYKILNENKSNLSDEEINVIFTRIFIGYDLKSIDLIMTILGDQELYQSQIMKPCFAVDFYNYKKHGVAISKFQYAHADRGPIIDDYESIFDFLLHNGYIKYVYDENDSYKIKRNNYIDLYSFDNTELEVINYVKNKLENKSPIELTEWSHLFNGWKETKSGQIIDFKYAKDFNI